MQKITLAGEHTGTRVVAGIKFTDGVATPNREITGPALDYLLTYKGATVEELAASGDALGDLDKPGLLAFAADHGIEVKKSANKADLLAAVTDGLEAKHAAVSAETGDGVPREQADEPTGTGTPDIDAEAAAVASSQTGE